MALSKFCPNLLLTLWNQNETMLVSRFFCRALDGCLLIKAILLLLPSYCQHCRESDGDDGLDSNHS